jgi:putative mRNA 3-end processing factor
MAVFIKLLGGGGEIGRNAIEINYNNNSILLDYGVIFNSEIGFPLNVNLKKLIGIIISHAHLDHIGALPLIYSSSINPKIYFNSMTSELMNLLLLDFLKVSKGNLQFDETGILKIFEKSSNVPFKYDFIINDFSIKVGNAGHIPGSWIISVEVKNKKILYTGDFNVYDTKLLNGAEVIERNVDLLICESTYACVNHIDRQKVEKLFIEKVLETLENKGNVLIPSFAVGRSQEILCILQKYNIKYPIFLDGMARKASSIMLKYPEYFKDYNLLKSSHDLAIWVNNERERKRILDEPSIIISPAGMLKGGPALNYIKKIISDSRNSILFVGYLAENTPGREILESHTFTTETSKEKVKANVYWFGLSSHTDMKGIIDYIKEVNPQKVMFIHGEVERIIEMSKLIKNNYSIDIILGKTGESIEV